MNVLIPNLGLAKKSDSDLHDYAEDKIIKVPLVFNDTTPKIGDVQLASTAFHAATLKAKHGTPADTADKNAKRMALSILITELAYDCVRQSNGSDVKFLACGFALKRKPTPAPALAPPANMRLTSTAEGIIDAEFDAVPGGLTYLVYIGEDGNNPDSFTLAGTCTDTKFTFENLTSGKRYYAIAYATGSRKKKGPFSGMATKICA